MDSEAPQPASATSQASSTPGASATDASGSPRKGQAKAAEALAAGATQLGKRQLADLLPAGSPAQRRELPSSSAGSIVESFGGEAPAAHDVGSAASKQSAASKWEADMINWSI